MWEISGHSVAQKLTLNAYLYFWALSTHSIDARITAVRIVSLVCETEQYALNETFWRLTYYVLVLAALRMSHRLSATLSSLTYTSEKNIPGGPCGPT